jgi:predicted NUDIX family NTP pyrophosphohydrolase
VHPRGATFRRPLFGIPKGAIEAGETPQQAAARETFEETGVRVDVHMELGNIEQRSGKIVHAFWATVRVDCSAAIDMEGRCVSHDFENDVCRFYPIERALPMMLPAQRELLSRLPKESMKILNHDSATSTERLEKE